MTEIPKDKISCKICKHRGESPISGACEGCNNFANFENDNTTRFNMRCRECKNIVPYMADEANNDYYKAVKLATSKRHNFAFRDYCGYCDKETAFGVVYPEITQENMKNE